MPGGFFFHMILDAFKFLVFAITLSHTGRRAPFYAHDLRLSILTDRHSWATIHPEETVDYVSRCLSLSSSPKLFTRYLPDSHLQWLTSSSSPPLTLLYSLRMPALSLKQSLSCCLRWLGSCRMRSPHYFVAALRCVLSRLHLNTTTSSGSRQLQIFTLAPLTI